MAKSRKTAVSTQERADGLTDAALECRDLLHAWPRRNVPAHAALITFEITAYRGGRASAARRVMECTGQCGVRKTQNYTITADGRILRDGAARYHYPDEGYRLRRPEAGATAEPLDRDALRYTVLSRLYPDLPW